MEIERKYLLKEIPFNLSDYNFHNIEQGYLSTNPVVRIRREDSNYYLTYKSSGLLSREEYNLPLTKESYEHLLTKVDGNIISKKRYLIPLNNNLLAELDIFNSPLNDLKIVEVEFSTLEEANTFIPPTWFGDDVTMDGKYHNSYLSHRL